MSEVGVPPSQWKSRKTEKVWLMAKKLASAEQRTVQMGRKLQYLGASLTCWGKCVIAAEIAGELLRERMDKAKANSEAKRERPPHRSCRQPVVPEAWSHEDMALYFAKRLAPLSDESGKVCGGRVRVEEIKGKDAELVAFFNKELKQAYVDLVLQIKASNAMSDRSSEVAFVTDGEVKAGASATDDSKSRYETAVKWTHRLYPLVVNGGEFCGCEMPSYKVFRSWLRMFLMVYKEFLLQGEVLYERMEEQASYAIVDGNGFGFRVRGAQQQDERERHLSFWSTQLFKLNMPDLKRRIERSRGSRMKMIEKLAEKRTTGKVAVAVKREEKQANDRANKQARKSGKDTVKTVKTTAKKGKSAIMAIPLGKGRRNHGGPRVSSTAIGKRKVSPSAGGNRKDKRGRRNVTSVDDGSGGDDGSDANTPDDSVETEPIGTSSESQIMVASESVDSDPLRIRDRGFDYTILTETPYSSYLSVVMMKGRLKPREKTMIGELFREDAKDNVGQYVAIGVGGGSTYIDVSTLTHNLHGKQSKKERDDCREIAEKNSLVSLSIPGGSSYLSKDVNVLYEGTAEYQRLIGNFVPDLNPVVQGVHQWVYGQNYTSDGVRRIVGRGNLQFTVGMSNHNFDKSKPADAGEVAVVDVQNETNLHKYFPDSGRALGVVLAKLASVRDSLVKERGGCEYNDEIRNQIFSGRVGRMFGLATAGFENSSVALTGHSRTLEEMVEKVLEKICETERAEERARFFGEGAEVETADHGDGLNPEDSKYSRVVLGKWYIHLERDREEDVLVVTVIGNHRSSVETYQAKMTGIRGMAQWIKEESETRQGEDGYIDYDADGDFLAHLGKFVTIGFVPDETKSISRDSIDKYGPGGFVAYSRPLSSEGGWNPLRETSVQASVASGNTQSNGQFDGGRKQVAVADVQGGVDPTKTLKKRSTVYGELLMKRGDYNRYADFSGCIWVIEEMRDRFRLNRAQARELALCVFWNTKSRAVFLLKCQSLLCAGPWADEFAKEAGKERDGGEKGLLGSYIMNMVDSELVGRMPLQLMRASNYNIRWMPEDEGFTPSFVAEQAEALKQFLTAAEKLPVKTTTASFLRRNVKSIRHVGEFVLPQVLPICYMLGLVKCDSLRAAEAPILDKTKRHYEKFIDLGADPKFLDLSMLVVALQRGTTPMALEHTGCEKVREQKNVHDFMLMGQLFYGMRPLPGCNYRNPKFVVYMKKWGPEGVWVQAERHPDGRWRYPS